MLFRKSEPVAPNRPNLTRTWGEVEELVEQLRSLANDGYGPFHMWVDRGEVVVVIKRDGCEFKGRGQDPWEAAADLMQKSGLLQAKLAKILERETVQA